MHLGADLLKLDTGIVDETQRLLGRKVVRQKGGTSEREAALECAIYVFYGLLGLVSRKVLRSCANIPWARAREQRRATPAKSQGARSAPWCATCAAGSAAKHPATFGRTHWFEGPNPTTSGTERR